MKSQTHVSLRLLVKPVNLTQPSADRGLLDLTRSQRKYGTSVPGYLPFWVIVNASVSRYEQLWTKNAALYWGASPNMLHRTRQWDLRWVV